MEAGHLTLDSRSRCKTAAPDAWAPWNLRRSAARRASGQDGGSSAVAPSQPARESSTPLLRLSQWGGPLRAFPPSACSRAWAPISPFLDQRETFFLFASEPNSASPYWLEHQVGGHLLGKTGRVSNIPGHVYTDHWLGWCPLTSPCEGY